MEDKYTRITLRIPKDLHEKLQYEADVSSKSMNAEIVARLEKSFLAEQAHSSHVMSKISQNILDLVTENRAMREKLNEILK